MPSFDPIGLCRSCRYAATSTSRSGSTFYRCRLAETNPAFRKYPPLPVLQCDGHDPVSPGAAVPPGPTRSGG